MNNSQLRLSRQNASDARNVVELSPGLPTDTGSTIRLGFLVLVIGFGGFLTWAAFAPLDEGVPTPASVTIDTKRKTIQHMTGGIVEKVMVREGQQVKAGDILLELNDGVNRANFESVRQNYMSQRAAESRLMAEIAGQPSINFHPDLMAASNDPIIKLHVLTQIQLFESRRSALNSELGAVNESIAGQEALLASNLLQQESRRLQAEKQSEQLRNVAELAKEGYVPRNQALQLEQSQAELNAVMAELQGVRLRTERAIAELKLRRTQRVMEASKESSAQLAEVRREVQAGQERLAATAGELRRVKIKAPVDGQVVGLMIASSGGVVSPGQKIMDIVPAVENVVLDAHIPPHVIDRVRTGDDVAIRFSTFAHSPQLVVDGKINSISGDVISEQTMGGTVSYYLARVSLTKEGTEKLGDRNLQPGMNAEVLIKTGERSLLTYLLHPLTKRIAASMKEE